LPFSGKGWGRGGAVISRVKACCSQLDRCKQTLDDSLQNDDGLDVPAFKTIGQEFLTMLVVDGGIHPFNSIFANVRQCGGIQSNEIRGKPLP
jgi:hypothetical protein